MGVEPGSDPHYARGVFRLLLTSVVYFLIAPGCPGCPGCLSLDSLVATFKNLNC